MGQLHSLAEKINGTDSIGRLFPEVDRAELTRLIIQSLADLGYTQSSRSLREESGLELDSPAIDAFSAAIKRGDLEAAEQDVAHLQLIDDTEDAKRHIVFLLKRERFMELLYVQNSTQEALVLLRHEVHELTDTANIRALTSLLMNKDSEELQRENGWLGDVRFSRESLLNDISKYINPNEMIPKYRLFKLLQQSLQYQRSRNLYQFGSEEDHLSLYEDAKSDKSNFPDTIVKILSNHEDEVWYVTFSHDGRILATASADNDIILYDVLNDFKILHILRGHSKQVMHCSFSPDDTRLLSCSLESRAHIWDVRTGGLERSISLTNSSRIWCCDWFPNGEAFVLGSPDNEIALFDSKSGEILHRWDGPVINDLKVSDDYKMIAVTYDKNVEVWDLKTHAKLATMDIGMRVTSLSVSKKNPNEIILNVSPNELQLWDWSRHLMLARYVGHKQEKFILRACFGYDEQLVACGSEDGRVFVWNREFGALLGVMDAHEANTNCVCWNPKIKGMFVSSGDDNLVKVWGPRTE